MTVAITEALESLSRHPDYRILRRLQPDSVGGPALIEGTIRRAAIIDSETTGMDPLADQVLEIGIVVFEYAAETGRVGSVTGSLSALEDPGRPIPPESTAIHGITDDMVRGRHFDEAAVTRALDGVGLVIAHNAGFDRPFLEARLPLFKELPWACSLKDIAWREAGHASASLEFLAYRAGFFYEGHRAEIDCRALLEVLARPIDANGDSALKRLLESARRPTVQLYALNSPFEAKDALKSRGYRWNGERRVWTLRLAEAQREAEQSWLKESVYGGRSVEVEIESQDARVRYSGREGSKRRIQL